jgi:hypothetical protein
VTSGVKTVCRGRSCRFGSRRTTTAGPRVVRTPPSLLTGMLPLTAPGARCWRPGYLQLLILAGSHRAWSKYAGLTRCLSPAAAEQCRSALTFQPARPQWLVNRHLQCPGSVLLCAYRKLLEWLAWLRSCGCQWLKGGRRAVSACVLWLRVKARAGASNAHSRIWGVRRSSLLICCCCVDAGHALALRRGSEAAAVND